MIKDKRKSMRRPMRYTAWVALEADQLHGCVLSDISDTGARIDVDETKTIPDQFMLLLSSNGSARRKCRVVWRKPRQIGVKFERRLADGEQASLVPKLDGRESRRSRAKTVKRDAEPAEKLEPRLRLPPARSAENHACWMADSSQSPPRARMKVHNSVTSLGLPPSTVRPLARSTMLSVSAKCMATVA